MKSVILDYAIERKEKRQVVYQYDFTESLNVVTIGNKRIAFIDSTNIDMSLQTKTRVINARDDNDSIIELQTKTKVAREQDDNFNFLLELNTKTFTAREQDDQGFDYN